MVIYAKIHFFLETAKKKAENLQAISKLRNAPADKHSQLCCVSTPSQPFRAQAPLADQDSGSAIAEPATSFPSDTYALSISKISLYFKLISLP